MTLLRESGISLNLPNNDLNGFVLKRSLRSPRKDALMKLRNKLLTGLLLACAALNAGCAMPIWSPNPDIRARQLIYASESMRHIPEIWERIWGLELPDLATPYRVHGGVI